MNKISMWIGTGLLFGAMTVAAQMRGDPGKMLEKADANQDGVITRDEYQQSRLDMFNKLDRNDDGFLDSQDAPKFKRRSGGGGTGERLEALKGELDKDSDGRISREEFANGPMLAFEKADANQDGQLDGAEIAAFKEFMAKVKEAKAAK